MLRSAVEEYPQLPVVSIQFAPAEQPYNEAQLRSILGIADRAPLDPVLVRQAIERLFATGRYQEIRVEAEKLNDGVALRFVTKGTWFIGRIDVDGVPEPPNRGQLISATKLRLGEELDIGALGEAERSLKTKLEANGFFEAKIDPSIRYDEARGQANVEFKVLPGPRAQFAPPVVNGWPADLPTDPLVRASRWRYFTGLLGWKPVTEFRVQRGVERIRRLLAKQDFLLSRVTLASLDYAPATRRATPALQVERGPKVEIRTSGAKLSRGRLRQLVPVYQEQSADRDLLVEGQRNLQTYFREQGFFRAKVNFESETMPDGRRAVTFFVERGERYKLRHLAVTGNQYFPAELIRERFSMLPATRLRYRYGRFNAGLLNADKDSIRELYQSNGFRNVRVESSTTENYGGKANALGVALEIAEGPQWFIGKVELAGPSDEYAQDLEERLSSVVGQPFSEANLTQDRDTVLNYYYNRGYPNAKFEWSVTPVPGEAHRVNVRFEVVEGQQQFVRGVLVDGLHATDPDLVTRRVRLEVGGPLSQGMMVESQRRLYDLGIFARVDMAVQNPDGEEPGKLILYELEEGRKYSVNFGLGAEITRIGSGDPNFEAPAGKPGFSPRVSLGLTRNNVFGTGHILSGQTRLSSIQRRWLGSYLAPQFKGRDDVSFNATVLYDISRDVRTFKSRRLEGALQLSNRLNRANTLQSRFTYRRNTVDDLQINVADIPIFSQAVRVGILSVTLFQDYRDDPIDSRRGYYNSVDFGYASKAFASQTDYVRLLARNSTYHRIGRDMVVARSTTLGALPNLRAGGPTTIPLPERYFSGGGSTHRGFPDNQAGPRDLNTGFPVGGTALLTNNVELRFPLYGESVGGVLFYDAGNVYRGVGDISFRIRQRDARDFSYLVHAVGLGLRYKTPVGPVRVDFGWAPNSPRFSYVRAGSPVTDRIGRLQFHFSLGETF